MATSCCCHFTELCSTQYPVSWRRNYCAPAIFQNAVTCLRCSCSHLSTQKVTRKQTAWNNCSYCACHVCYLTFRVFLSAGSQLFLHCPLGAEVLPGIVLRHTSNTSNKLKIVVGQLNSTFENLIGRKSPKNFPRYCSVVSHCLLHHWNQTLKLWITIWSRSSWLF